MLLWKNFLVEKLIVTRRRNKKVSSSFFRSPIHVNLLKVSWNPNRNRALVSLALVPKPAHNGAKVVVVVPISDLNTRFWLVNYLLGAVTIKYSCFLTLQKYIFFNKNIKNTIYTKYGGKITTTILPRYCNGRLGLSSDSSGLLSTQWPPRPNSSLEVQLVGW